MTLPEEAMIETLKSIEAELTAMRKDLDNQQARVLKMIGSIEFVLQGVEKTLKTSAEAAQAGSQS